jgi:hypothetical protein
MPRADSLPALHDARLYRAYSAFGDEKPTIAKYGDIVGFDPAPMWLDGQHWCAQKPTSLLGSVHFHYMSATLKPSCSMRNLMASISPEGNRIVLCLIGLH